MPALPSPLGDGLSAWSPGQVRGGSGFAPSRGSPDEKRGFLMHKASFPVDGKTHLGEI